MRARNQRVGFIGLGNMGGPMAVNLARAGFPTVVYDVRSEALDDAVGAGAETATSVAQLAAATDVVATCVLYDHQVRQVFEGDHGILANAGSGTVAVVHSTVRPDTVAELATRAASAGIDFVDAPVSGGSIKAARGELTIMVGGDAAAVERTAELFDVLGTNVFHVGAVGAGQTMKLANNIMSYINRLGLIEALRFAEAHGLAAETVMSVAATSGGASKALDGYDAFLQLGSEHTLAGTPEIAHRFAKDLRLAVDQANASLLSLPLAGLAAQLAPAMFEDEWRRRPVIG